MERRFKAVTLVDAAFILNTRPGIRVGDIFGRALEVYRETGYADEWWKHYQGGLKGYAGREYRVSESTQDVVEINQVYTWNPSIAGTKSEDTMIVGADKNEIITFTGEFVE